MKKFITRRMRIAMLILFSLLVTSISAQTKVVIPGTFQSELGCEALPYNYYGDWDPNCDFTALTYNYESGLWSGTFQIPAGCHQYKVAIDGSWSENYGEYGVPGGANINLAVTYETSIRFTYNPWTHLVETSPIASGFSTSCLPEVVLTGSLQSELGCGGDWIATCSNTALAYNYETGKFEGDLTIPEGCYEYRPVLSGDWANSYGIYGYISDPNYLLSVTENSATVHFSYDPFTHIVTSSFNTNYCPPSTTVVIAASFQSELGCSGDWEPFCDNSRMTFDTYNGVWVDTLTIPAGHWEFKVALNNSWAENYGLYGEPYGQNIPLDLCYPATVAFTFYNYEYYHDVYAQIITNGVCITKFYDANVSGFQDYGEPPMEGIAFTLSGNGIEQTQLTGADGKIAFTDLPDGEYQIQEAMPSGYLSTGYDSSLFAYVNSSSATLFVGNVCLGQGGAKSIGYWTSKNGEAALTNSGNLEYFLWVLRYISLRNADGSDFDPYTYLQFKNWMMKANSKNITYMLSAQMAAMYLNLEMNYVSYESILYTPGCGYMGNGNFLDVYSLIWYTNYYLTYYTTVTGGSPERNYLECLKSSFDNANNNLTFVQSSPCVNTTEASNARLGREETDDRSTLAEIYPNPANTFFTVKPADRGGELIMIKVMDVNGRALYTTEGSAYTNYSFGNDLPAGLYFVQIIQGVNRPTIKVIKQ